MLRARHIVVAASAAVGVGAIATLRVGRLRDAEAHDLPGRLSALDEMMVRLAAAWKCAAASNVPLAVALLAGGDGGDGGARMAHAFVAGAGHRLLFHALCGDEHAASALSAARALRDLLARSDVGPLLTRTVPPDVWLTLARAADSAGASPLELPAREIVDVVERATLAQLASVDAAAGDAGVASGEGRAGRCAWPSDNDATRDAGTWTHARVAALRNAVPPGLLPPPPAVGDGSSTVARVLAAASAWLTNGSDASGVPDGEASPPWTAAAALLATGGDGSDVREPGAPPRQRPAIGMLGMAALAAGSHAPPGPQALRCAERLPAHVCALLDATLALESPDILTNTAERARLASLAIANVSVPLLCASRSPNKDSALASCVVALATAIRLQSSHGSAVACADALAAASQAVAALTDRLAASPFAGHSLPLSPVAAAAISQLACVASTQLPMADASWSTASSRFVHAHPLAAAAATWLVGALVNCTRGTPACMARHPVAALVTDGGRTQSAAQRQRRAHEATAAAMAASLHAPASLAAAGPLWSTLESAHDGSLGHWELTDDGAGAGSADDDGMASLALREDELGQPTALTQVRAGGWGGKGRRGEGGGG
jgi:hypothetical protein